MRIIYHLFLYLVLVLIQSCEAIKAPLSPGNNEPEKGTGGSNTGRPQGTQYSPKLPEPISPLWKLLRESNPYKQRPYAPPEEETGNIIYNFLNGAGLNIQNLLQKSNVGIASLGPKSPMADLKKVMSSPTGFTNFSNVSHGLITQKTIPKNVFPLTAMIMAGYKAGVEFAFKNKLYPEKITDKEAEFLPVHAALVHLNDDEFKDFWQKHHLALKSIKTQYTDADGNDVEETALLYSNPTTQPFTALGTNGQDVELQLNVNPILWAVWLGRHTLADFLLDELEKFETWPSASSFL